MNLTDEDVQEILRLLERSPYGDLKLETDRFTIELKSTGSAREYAEPAAELAAPAVPAAAGPAPAAGEIVEIRPPLPGTFYRAPSPGAEPFTEVGQAVDEASILGLVETMKLMNSVVAGCCGEVVEICVENGTLVEVDDVLVRVRVATDG